MFDLENWNNRRKKTAIQVLAGVLLFVFLTLPILYQELIANGKQEQGNAEEREDVGYHKKAELLVLDTKVQQAAKNIDLLEETESKVEEADIDYDILQEYSFTLQREEATTESYEAETKYIDNPVWASDREVVISEAHEGTKEIKALVTYKGKEEIDREILDISVMEEAQGAVIERGVREPAEYIRPLTEGRFTSGFGPRWGRMHSGADWGVAEGTPIYAAKSGKVSWAAEKGTYGNVVFISHGDGTETRYAHLSVIEVEAGDEVVQGDRIALSGNTGRSTGPHLHFEIRINGEAINPLDKLQ